MKIIKNHKGWVVGSVNASIKIFVAFLLLSTGWPQTSHAQNSLMWQQQQRMQQQRMLDQQRRQQEQARQQREAERRQREAQRRRIEEQRRRQQAAQRQRQQEMQIRRQQQQAQRQKQAEKRRVEQQRRQQDKQRKEIQRKQVVQKQAQRTARIARDRARQLERDRRLQQLRQRTRLEQQQQQNQNAAQRTTSAAVLSRAINQQNTFNSRRLLNQRQETAKRFGKLRASKQKIELGSSRNGSGNNNIQRSAVLATKQYQKQKLQEFRNRQALNGAKDTKQDLEVEKKSLPGPKLENIPNARLVINSFAARQYTNRQLSQDTKMYKYHGINNRTGKKETWLTNKKYDNESELRKDLAIRKEWGKITHVSEFKIPKKTWISEGKAAKQGENYPGGGYQAVILNVPRAWVVRTDKAFK